MQESDKKAFDTSICTMLEACNRNYKPSQSVRRAYWEPLAARFTLQEVQAGIGYVIANQAKGEHVTPGDVVAASRDKHQARLRADEDRPRPSAVPDSPHSFAAMLGDATPAFAIRCTGMRLPGETERPKYTGGFDWRFVVQAAELPNLDHGADLPRVGGVRSDESRARLAHVDQVFAKFRTLVKYEWDQWQAKQA